jgi:hypothetical protein
MRAPLRVAARPRHTRLSRLEAWPAAPHDESEPLEKSVRSKIMMFAAAACAALSASGAFAQAAAPAAATVSCDAHVFETSVQTVTKGKAHTSKVKLCGNEGQSDFDWAVTLKDARDTVQANPKMPPEVKRQIGEALKAEIAKVEARIPAPTVSPPAVAPAPAPVLASPVAAAPQAPVVAPPVLASKVTIAPPRLSIECYTPGDIGSGGPCLTLQRDTLLTVRADRDMTAAARLRFTHRGDARGELAIPPMREGQSRRVRMPADVCRGGAPGRIAIEVSAAGASTGAAETLGPFNLRC